MAIFYYFSTTIKLCLVQWKGKEERRKKNARKIKKRVGKESIFSSVFGYEEEEKGKM